MDAMYDGRARTLMKYFSETGEEGGTRMGVWLDGAHTYCCMRGVMG